MAGWSLNCPVPAWMRMLRAASEIAVAIRVASVREKPSSLASARPSARAGTTSSSEAIAIVTSPFCDMAASRSVVEQGECFLEIERGLERRQVELELHHRDGDVGLDPDDHGVRATQLRGQGDRA